MEDDVVAPLQAAEAALRPRVGAVCTEYRSVCVYSPAPGEHQCDKTATRHVRVEDKIYGEVALQSCEEHVGIARAAGRFVQEHAYDDDTCASPRALWVLELSACTVEDTVSVAATDLSSRPEGDEW